MSDANTLISVDEVAILKNSLKRAQRLIEHFCLTNPEVYYKTLQSFSQVYNGEEEGGEVAANFNVGQMTESNREEKEQISGDETNNKDEEVVKEEKESTTTESELKNMAGMIDTFKEKTVLDMIVASPKVVKIPLSQQPKSLLAVALATGKVSSVVNLLSLNPTNLSVVRRCLKALKDYSSLPSDKDGDKIRLEMAALGTIELICTAFKNFTLDEGVNHHSVRILGNLSFGNPDNRAKIGILCIPFILSTYEKFKNNINFIFHTTQTLTNISHQNTVNCRLLKNQGIITLILDNMENYPTNPKLQRLSIWLFISLSGEDTTCKTIIEEGGVGAILASMLNFNDDSDIQHFGIWAFLNLSLSSCFEICKFLAINNVGRIVQDAVRSFPGEENIVNKAAKLLRNIDEYIVKV